jgi:hypothetical protein
MKMSQNPDAMRNAMIENILRAIGEANIVATTIANLNGIQPRRNAMVGFIS